MGRIGVCVFALRVVFVGVLLNLALVRMGSALPIGNAIKNPGFEDGLAFWSVSMGTATYSADNTVFLIGSRSAKGVEPFRGSLGRLFQDVTGLLVVGGDYTIFGMDQDGGCL